MSRADSPRNILCLPTKALRWLARNAIAYDKDVLPLGFSSTTKGSPVGDGYTGACGTHAVQQYWPYPCARPLTYTCWRYNTWSARSTHALALQLRLLWVYTRWDPLLDTAPREAFARRQFAAIMGSALLIPMCVYSNADGVKERRTLVDHKEHPPNGLYAEYLCRVQQLDDDDDNENRVNGFGARGGARGGGGRGRRSGAGDVAYRSGGGRVLGTDKGGRTLRGQQQAAQDSSDEDANDSEDMNTTVGTDSVELKYIGENELNVSLIEYNALLEFVQIWEMRAYWQRVEQAAMTRKIDPAQAFANLKALTTNKARIDDDDGNNKSLSMTTLLAPVAGGGGTTGGNIIRRNSSLVGVPFRPLMHSVTRPIMVRFCLMMTSRMSHFAAAATTNGCACGGRWRSCTDGHYNRIVNSLRNSHRRLASVNAGDDTCRRWQSATLWRGAAPANSITSYCATIAECCANSVARSHICILYNCIFVYSHYCNTTPIAFGAYAEW